MVSYFLFFFTESKPTLTVFGTLIVFVFTQIDTRITFAETSLQNKTATLSQENETVLHRPDINWNIRLIASIFFRMKNEEIHWYKQNYYKNMSSKNQTEFESILNVLANYSQYLNETHYKPYSPSNTNATTKLPFKPDTDDTRAPLSDQVQG